MDFGNLSRSSVEHLIDEWVFNETYRAILKRRFLDGICYEPLAEEFGMSVRQVKRIVYKYGDKVLDHVPNYFVRDKGDYRNGYPK